MTEYSVSTTETGNRQANRSSKPRRSWEWVKYLLSILILAGGVAIYFALSSLAKKSEEQASEQLVPLIATEAIQPYAGQIDMVVSELSWLRLAWSNSDFDSALRIRWLRSNSALAIL